MERKGCRKGEGVWDSLVIPFLKYSRYTRRSVSSQLNQHVANVFSPLRVISFSFLFLFFSFPPFLSLSLYLSLPLSLSTSLYLSLDLSFEQAQRHSSDCSLCFASLNATTQRRNVALRKMSSIQVFCVRFISIILSYDLIEFRNVEL